MAETSMDAWLAAVPERRYFEGVERHQPVFTGKVGEYFGIWFVNVLLSILTLGIYSAWAKVRTERYFYANTTLADAHFDYLASPLSILKGRLIAYAVIIALVVTSRTAPAIYALLFLCVILLMPCLIVLTLRFRARNSAWRGLRFHFERPVAGAYGPYFLWRILSSLSLTLLYPAMKQRQHEFVVEGHRYGKARFQFQPSQDYYSPYWRAIGLIVGLVVMLALLVAGIVNNGLGAVGAGAPMMAVMLLWLAAFYGGLFFLSIYLSVRYANLLWASTRIGSHRFESTLRVRDMCWLYLTNAVAIVLSLGLAVPWAMIRLARYRAAHFTLVASGSLDDFAAGQSSASGAASAELLDALDTGLDLGM